ncbi:MAG: GLPGLI family protein [Prevotella sp.]|nr:GLPGLI family protein [Prevotella sp.]
MKKILVTMMAFVLTIAAQGQVETVDTAQFVAVYDYECRTQNDEGQDVTDKAQVVVQVGRTVTKSMPGSSYRLPEEKSIADLKVVYQEAMLHIPTVWTSHPMGQTTVRDLIFPQEFEGMEPTPEIAWILTEDTLTVSGYLCQHATATFRGVVWQVYYTEEIPSSAGPWRLRGLPGLIVRAESEAHTFCLAELRQESTPITYERKPDVQKVSYAKLMKHRNEVYGNKQYVKNPTYYIPDLGGALTHVEVFKNDGEPFVFANDYPLLTKVHVYQLLEKE